MYWVYYENGQDFLEGNLIDGQAGLRGEEPAVDGHRGAVDHGSLVRQQVQRRAHHVFDLSKSRAYAFSNW